MDSYLQRTLDLIETSTKGITPQELAAHVEGKWCIGEILEHLTLTFNGTCKAVERGVKEHAPSAKPSLKQRAMIAAVVKMGVFPKGRKAPKMTVPGGKAPEKSVKVIRESLTTLDKALADCEKRLGPKYRLPHPVLGALTVPEYRKFHYIHTRHHMKQVDALRNRFMSAAETMA